MRKASHICAKLYLSPQWDLLPQLWDTTDQRKHCGAGQMRGHIPSNIQDCEVTEHRATNEELFSP